MDNEKLRKIELSLSDSLFFNTIITVAIVAKIFNLTDLSWLQIIAGYVSLLLANVVYEVCKKLIELLRSQNKNARGQNA